MSSRCLLAHLAAFGVVWGVAPAASAQWDGHAGGGTAPAARPDRKEIKPRDAAPAAASDADSRWTIVLGVFSSADHAERAAAAVEALRPWAKALPSEARPQRRGRGTAVVVGSYASSSDEAAKKDLGAVRAIMSENGKPAFPGAFLAPPATREDPGQLPRYHLLKAREEFGGSVRYTLQVAVYESPDREEAKRAAEQAAAVLRKEGEPAYYFHGVTQSMVTLGAFTDREAGLKDGKESAELSGLRQRHGLNLFNGNRKIMEGGAKGAAQASFLVEIPEGR